MAGGRSADSPASILVRRSGRRRGGRRARLLVVAGSVTAVTLGIVLVAAILHATRPSLSLFDRASTAEESALEQSLRAGRDDVQVRLLFSADGSPLYAVRTTNSGEESTSRPLVCVGGEGEFSELELTTCVDEQIFLLQGMSGFIPSPGFGASIESSDGYRFRWGPLGAGEVHYVPAPGAPAPSNPSSLPADDGENR